MQGSTQFLASDADTQQLAEWQPWQICECAMSSWSWMGRELGSTESLHDRYAGCCPDGTLLVLLYSNDGNE